MKTIKYIIAITLTVFLASCKPTEPPAPYKYESNPTFTWGFAEFYGNYYSNRDIENNVITLHLFTEKLKLNEKGELTGTGQYLILEDIFIAPTDTLLPFGNYKTAETGVPFTFFSGKKFEDNRTAIPSGAYIYYIETDPTKSKISYVTDGSLTINTLNFNNYSVECKLTLDDKVTGKFNEKGELTGTFKGELKHYYLYAETPPNGLRKKIKIAR